MTATVPEWVQARGYWNVYWLPAASDLTAITLTEFAAGVDITCYLPDPQWDGVTGEQERFEQTRACLLESFEVLGSVTRGIGDLTYTVLPQEAPTHDGNAVSSALAPGTAGVMVLRRGKIASSAIAVGDKYSALRATAGLQKENMGGDDGAPTTNTSSLSATGTVVSGEVVT